MAAKTQKTTQKSESSEREYVIPLRAKFQHVPRYRKTEKAVKTIKEFLARHMKVYDRDLDKIKLDRLVNEFMWARGIKNPPHKIKVKAKKDGEIVRVELVDMPDKLKFKKAREDKREAAGKEVAKKKAAEKKKEEKAEAKEEENKESGEEKEIDKVKEKQESSKIQEEKIEKEIAKEMKHTTGVKSPKEEKNQKTGYNKSSRGK